MLRFTTVATLALLAGSASAEVVLDGDEGGALSEYQDRVRDVAESGERVRLRGACRSACTLYLQLGHQLCYDGGSLWFHAARDPATYLQDDRATDWLMRVYPPEFQDFIRSRGGLGPKWIVLRGKRLRKMIGECENG